jgi:hypothetical protein
VASPAPLSPGEPAPPAADPVAIRACLTPDVAAEFDREWEIVLDRAKQTKDLAGVRDLLAKWRLFAHAELTDPGSYFRVLATATRALATGQAPAGSGSGQESKELIRSRWGR